MFIGIIGLFLIANIAFVEFGGHYAGISQKGIMFLMGENGWVFCKLLNLKTEAQWKPNRKTPKWSSLQL